MTESTLGGEVRSQAKTWIIGAAIAVVSAIAVVLAQAWIIPVVHDLFHPLAQKADSAAYVVLVADLSEDDAPREEPQWLADLLGHHPQSDRLARLLTDQFKALENNPIQIRRIPRMLSLSADDAVLEQTETQGRAWIERAGGDVMIWGAVRKDNEEIDLRILQPDGGGGGAQYGMTDLKFKTAVLEQLAPALAGTIAADAAPAYEGGRFAADVLTPVAARLGTIAFADPPILSGATLGNVMLAYADTALAVGQQTSDPEPLRAAIEAYKGTLTLFPRSSFPEEWGMTQNNLGTALASLGRQGSDSKLLEEAVVAFRAALEVHVRERMPLDWAMTQSNLGATLSSLGQPEGGTKRLEEGVVALRAALEERTREREPLGWADTQSNLGVALMSIGERETGTKHLEEAVTVFRAALEEHARERVPLSWAMTQDNLGTALFNLGERETGTKRLEEAIAAYRAALQERTRSRAPLDWAYTQTSLGNALSTLGERESGTKHLEESVAAYRAALEVLTKEHTPDQWATAQLNLGMTLHGIAERESGTKRLEEALLAFGAASEVFKRDRTPIYWAAMTQSVALVRATIGDKGIEPRGNYMYAADLLRSAIPELEKASPYRAEIAKENLSHIYAKLKPLL